jgi:hypothetical protein
MVQYSDLARVVRGMLDGTVGPLYGREDSSGRDQPDLTRGPWDGDVSFRQAADYLDRGWEDGITDALEGLNVNAPDMSTSGGYDLDIAGEYVSVPSFCAGAPDCMMRKEAGDAPRRVRLIINPWLVCHTSAATAIAYAKATCAYASGLIQVGYDVAVTAVYAARINHEDVGAVPISVKEFSQEPDASRLAFATHPAFCRHVMWAYCEATEDVHPRLASHGYGLLLRDDLTESEIRKILPDAADERMVVLPALGTARWTNHEQWLALFQSIAFETQDKDGTETEDEL